MELITRYKCLTLKKKAMAKKVSGIGAVDRALKATRGQISKLKAKEREKKAVERKKKALAKAQAELKRLKAKTSVRSKRKR